MIHTQTHTVPPSAAPQSQASGWATIAPLGAVSLGGLLALGAYAWLRSPTQMMAIGLPFYILVVGWMLLSALQPAHVRDLPMPAQASVPLRSVPLKHWLVMSPFMLVFVYIAWGWATNTGLVGWLNAVQARSDGHFSPRLSFAVACIDFFDLLLAVGVIGMLFERNRWPAGAKSPPVAMPAAPSSPPGSPAARRTSMPLRRHAQALGLLMLLLGVYFLGQYGFETWRQRQALQAVYAPVDAAAPLEGSAGAEFVALHAALHPGGYVTLRDDHDRAHRTDFVPLVGVPAAPDATVQWVLRIDVDGAATPKLEFPLLAHDRGEGLPPAVRESLERIGVQLAPDARLADLTPSRDGHALDGSREIRSRLALHAGAMGVALVIGLLILGVLRLRQGSDDRQPSSPVRADGGHRG